MAGEPGHASSQGAAFYAQDFIGDIGVRTVRRPCHGTKHGHGYTKHFDNKHIPRHNQHPARNNLDPARDDFDYAVWFDGNTANFPARSHLYRQSCGNTGNTRRSGKRGICNRRDTGQRPDSDWTFNDRRAMHAGQ